MADGDLVRSIKITATGENIDSTKRSVDGLADSTGKASAANDNYKKQTDTLGGSLVTVAAGLYVAKTAMDAVATASDGASSAYGKVIAGMTGGAKEAIMFLPNIINSVWQEGIDKLNSYVELSAKAGVLSTDYYQTIVKGAEAAKIPVGDLLKQIQTMESSLTRVLGTDGIQNGSAFNMQVESLKKNGNLSGQSSGVNNVNNAVGAQEQYAASLDLIKKVQDSGEKLVALDLSKTLFGDAARENLAKDSFYLESIKIATDKVKAEDLIKQPDVDRAVGMKLALEAAYKVLDDRGKKANSDWSGWGIEIQGAWVNIVTQYASALTWLDKILGRTNDIARASGEIKPSMWTGVSDYFTKGMSADQIKDQFGVDQVTPAERQMADARKRLASPLQNPANAANNNAYLQSFDDKFTPDSSKPPPKQIIDESGGAYGRASEQLLKYISVTDAASKSVGDTAFQQERLKAAAQLTAAGLKDGLTPEAAALKAEMSGLAEKAGIAADALAKARVANSINFDRKTAFLSAEDVSIAQQLRTIYGNDIPRALASTEAAGIRLNTTFRDFGNITHTAFDSMAPALREALNGTKSLGDGFKALGLTAVNALQDMIIKLTIIKPLENAVMGGLGGLFGSSSLPIPGMSSFIGPVAHSGGVLGMDSFPSHNTPSAVFNNAPRYHTGLMPDEFPAILQKGEGVFTKGQMASMGGGGSGTVQMNDNRTIHIGAGASQQTVEQLKAAFEQDRKQRYADTVKIIADARGRGVRV